MNRIISFNRIYFLRFLFIFALVALFLVPIGAAYAQTAAANAVAATSATAFSLQPIINTIVLPILAALATALAGWAMTKIATLAHLSAQSALRTFLEQVIDNGIAWAVQEARVAAGRVHHRPGQQLHRVERLDLCDDRGAGHPEIAREFDLTTPAGQKQLEN